MSRAHLLQSQVDDAGPEVGDVVEMLQLSGLDAAGFVAHSRAIAAHRAPLNVALDQQYLSTLQDAARRSSGAAASCPPAAHELRIHVLDVFALARDGDTAGVSVTLHGTRGQYGPVTLDAETSVSDETPFWSAPRTEVFSLKAAVGELLRVELTAIDSLPWGIRLGGVSVLSSQEGFSPCQVCSLILAAWSLLSDDVVHIAGQLFCVRQAAGLWSARSRDRRARAALPRAGRLHCAVGACARPW